MRFFFTGPRIFGIRPGILLGPSDFRAPRRRVTAAPVEGSFLYVIQGTHGLVKVGITTDPRARLASLQTASPYPLEFRAIAATPGSGGLEIEATAHMLLAPYRRAGEWFAISPRMAIEAVGAAAQGLGKPLLPVSLDRADEILAIARAAPQDAPARSGRVTTALTWFLLVVFAFVLVLITIGRITMAGG